MQERVSEREPALALVGVTTNGVFEAAKGALADDGVLQRGLERHVFDGGDEALHHPVLLARRNRLDAHEVAGGSSFVDVAAVFAIDEEFDLAALSVEEGALIGRVALKGRLEQHPIDRQARHDFTSMLQRVVVANASVAAVDVDTTPTSLARMGSSGVSLPSPAEQTGLREDTVAIDWKSRLIETKTKAPTSFEHVVRQVVADGSASLAEVKGFLAQHKDVFGDDGQQAAKKAAETLLDSTSPKMAAPTTTGLKAHNLRGASAWHGRVQLPSPPVVLIGRGEPVTVDGERFTQHDVAELLKLAA